MIRSLKKLQIWSSNLSVCREKLSKMKTKAHCIAIRGLLNCVESNSNRDKSFLSKERETDSAMIFKENERVRKDTTLFRCIIPNLFISLAVAAGGEDGDGFLRCLGGLQVSLQIRRSKTERNRCSSTHNYTKYEFFG